MALYLKLALIFLEAPPREGKSSTAGFGAGLARLLLLLLLSVLLLLLLLTHSDLFRFGGGTPLPPRAGKSAWPLLVIPPLLKPGGGPTFIGLSTPLLMPREPMSRLRPGGTFCGGLDGCT